jgi:hypothetical protein
MAQANPKEILWKGDGFERGTFVRKRKMNKVILPEDAEDCVKNHIYSNRTDSAGNREGYVAVEYEHQEFPRMLFHPDYHKVPAPHPNQFASPDKTGMFTPAEEEWKRKYDRIQVAENEKDVKRLTAMGWLLTPPKSDIPAYDANSEAI